MTTQPIPQAPQTAAKDLARMALHNARKAAKAAPPSPRETRRARQTSRRTDGRDPLPLGTAISRLTDEYAWNTPTAGGGIIDQWPSIAPELAGKVAAVRFDADTGTLHLRPGSPAYAMQLRTFQQQIIDQICAKTGSGIVTALHVLAPGAVPQTPAAGRPDSPEPRPVAPPEPRTRDDAHPGYHHALAAIRRPGHTTDPAIRAARERQERTQAREPETKFTDAIAAQEDAAAQAAAEYDPERTRRAAIQQARAQRAGQDTSVRTVFGRTA